MSPNPAYLVQIATKPSHARLCGGQGWCRDPNPVCGDVAHDKHTVELGGTIGQIVEQAGAHLDGRGGLETPLTGIFLRITLTSQSSAGEASAYAPAC